ncbi:MAG TPA: tetratricopeptide repeat protein [Vicinamibacteria bacterium]|nr:tetratricopeptide repeat protein [Vicinamibacteria bacterium]
MLPKAAPSAASALALETAAAPKPLQFSGDAVGQAGSKDALARLTKAMAELKSLSVEPLLQRAVKAIQAEDWKNAGELVSQALERDKDNGFGWYLLAIVRERLGDFAESILAYEAALRLVPQHAEVANDLGRLASRMGMKAEAEKLFQHFLTIHPDNPEALNNLACVVRDQFRYEDAVEILRPAILKNPENSLLWNTMGTVMSEQGDFTNADVFFQEALRLDQNFFRARFNMGNARLALGDNEGALAAVEGALGQVRSEDERQMMLLSRSLILLNLSRVGEGWDGYEARLHPRFHDCTHFLFEQPRWEPGMDLKGKTLLVVGEQGLGDEVLFSNVLPDVIERLGSEAGLILAVEPRLVPLYRRTYPKARVEAHSTYIVATKTIRYVPALLKELDTVDCWTPIASLLREFRPTVESFPDRRGFVTPDPERVAHWRRTLESAPAGPKVGLLWKSAINRDARHRFFSPFDQWAPVLQTPDACFVNLQYGDCAEEIAQAKARLGVDIWTPPGIDLRQDLDDVAALASALDLTIGFSNATLNLAAACGAPTWLISVPGTWTRLGTARYPWYPQVRTFTAAAYGAWGPLMESVGEAFQGFVSEH